MKTLPSGKSPVLSFGIILLVFGAAMCFIKAYADWNGADAVATVSSILEGSKTDSTGTKIVYWPAVWFITETRDTVKGFLPYQESAVRYKVGETIPIVYKKDDVKDFHAAKSFLWYVLFGIVALSGIGVIYLSAKIQSEK